MLNESRDLSLYGTYNSSSLKHKEMNEERSEAMHKTFTHKTVSVYAVLLQLILRMN